jgi:Tol biopolymer transport system component
MTRKIRTRRWLISLAAMATVLAMVVPAWATFPNQGSRILYAHAKSTNAARVMRGAGPGIDLFTMKPNGNDQRRLVKTRSIIEYGGHWSPNGSRIVFAGLKGKGQANIYTTEADGSHRRMLTTTDDNFTPNWSKNGKQIVWTRLGVLKPSPMARSRLRRGIPGGNLMIMDEDGSGKHSLYTGLALSPGANPSTGRVAFSTVDGDSLDVWTIKPNGLGLQQLTDYGIGSYTVFGDWAPDGDSFAFTWSPGVTRGPSGYSLWVAPTSDPTDTLLLASGVSEIFAPVFTLDGSRVVFVRQDGEDYEIFSVKTDGTGEKQLTLNPGMDILSVVPLF